MATPFITIHHSPLIFRIAIFASGAGSNAQTIIDYFTTSPLTLSSSLRAKRSKEGVTGVKVEVSLIVCNKPGAGVISIASKENIPVLLIEKEKFFHGSGYVDELKEKQIDLIVLAGFLWKIPDALIKAYPQRIINIHPALLPAFGGRGMYGSNVHTAVIAAGEKESGITIHYVDEHYDNGDIIFQASCPVLPGDTPGSLARRIQGLEHEHFPRVISGVVGKLIGL